MEGDNRVQVYARSRPLREQESALAASCVELVDGDTTSVCVRGEASQQGHSAEARSFVFDAVYGAEATQGEVYEQVGKPVLRECMKGFNGAILAYGQTGSGKTHSLLNHGQSLSSDENGLLPRIVAGLFVHIATDVINSYEVEAAAMQVYNEQVDDLLHPDRESGFGFALHVQNGGAVPALTWVRCQKPETLLNAFYYARSNLVYAETKLNKASSRSHAVFQIRIAKYPRAAVQSTDSGDSRVPQQVERTCARLSVVDLAGSERVKKSCVEGTQLKEALAINKSLHVFGNVVSALAGKKPHVPFRESKLTRILDGSIGGNCKTSLLVCLSPAAEHVAETLSTLEFASRAMKVEVDAKVNKEVVEVTGSELLQDLCGDIENMVVAALKEEIALLTRSVASAEERLAEEARQRAEAALAADLEATECRREAEAARAEAQELRAARDDLAERLAREKAAAGEALAESRRERDDARRRFEEEIALLTRSVASAEERLADESRRRAEAALAADLEATECRREAEAARAEVQELRAVRDDLAERLSQEEAAAGEAVAELRREREAARRRLEEDLAQCREEMSSSAAEAIRAMRRKMEAAMEESEASAAAIAHAEEVAAKLREGHVSLEERVALSETLAQQADARRMEVERQLERASEELENSRREASEAARMAEVSMAKASSIEASAAEALREATVAAEVAEVELRRRMAEEADTRIAEVRATAASDLHEMEERLNVELARSRAEGDAAAEEIRREASAARRMAEASIAEASREAAVAAEAAETELRRRLLAEADARVAEVEAVAASRLRETEERLNAGLARCHAETKEKVEELRREASEASAAAEALRKAAVATEASEAELRRRLAAEADARVAEAVAAAEERRREMEERFEAVLARDRAEAAAKVEELELLRREASEARSAAEASQAAAAAAQAAEAESRGRAAAEAAARGAELEAEAGRSRESEERLEAELELSRAEAAAAAEDMARRLAEASTQHAEVLRELSESRASVQELREARDRALERAEAAEAAKAQEMEMIMSEIQEQWERETNQRREEESVRQQEQSRVERERQDAIEETKAVRESADSEIEALHEQIADLHRELQLLQPSSAIAALDLEAASGSTPPRSDAFIGRRRRRRCSPPCLFPGDTPGSVAAAAVATPSRACRSPTRRGLFSPGSEPDGAVNPLGVAVL